MSAELARGRRSLSAFPLFLWFFWELVSPLWDLFSFFNASSRTAYHKYDTFKSVRFERKSTQMLPSAIIYNSLLGPRNFVFIRCTLNTAASRADWRAVNTPQEYVILRGEGNTPWITSSGKTSSAAAHSLSKHLTGQSPQDSRGS